MEPVLFKGGNGLALDTGRIGQVIEKNILPAPADNTGTKTAFINPLALFLTGHIETQIANWDK